MLALENRAIISFAVLPDTKESIKINGVLTAHRII